MCQAHETTALPWQFACKTIKSSWQSSNELYSSCALYVMKLLLVLECEDESGQANSGGIHGLCLLRQIAMAHKQQSHRMVALLLST